MNIELFNFEYIIVFHGSTSDHKESLSKVSLSNCALCTDFGQGFYTTTKYKQALRWAESKAKAKNNKIDRINKKIIGKKKESRVRPLVKAYVFKNKPSKLKIFDKPETEWKEFLYDCRIDFLKHEYDIVYGPLGDTGIAQLIAEVNEGIINREGFIEKIDINSDFQFDDQISFHTEQILDRLEDLGEVFNDGNAKRIQSEYERKNNAIKV